MKLIGLIKSKTREKILKFFFTRKDKKYYLRELEKCLKLPIGNIGRELISLEKIGLFKKEKVKDIEVLRYRPNEYDVEFVNCPAGEILLRKAYLGKDRRFFKLKGDQDTLSETLLLPAFEAYVWSVLYEENLLCKNKKAILVDRMHDSSIAIQGALLRLEGFFVKETYKFLYKCYTLIGYPKIRVLLDFPFKDCISRIKKRDKETINKKYSSITKLIYNGFYYLKRRNPERFFSVRSQRMVSFWKGRPYNNYDINSIVEEIKKHFNI